MHQALNHGTVQICHGVALDPRSSSYGPTAHPAALRPAKQSLHPAYRRSGFSHTCTAVYSDEGPLEYTARDYTWEYNEDYWSRRPVTVLKRTLQIGRVFGGWYLTNVLGQGQDPQTLGAKQAQRLREILTELGPAFVKIGQAFSSRPDILPPTLLQELEKLQDKIPPYPDAEAMQIILEDLGQPAASVYSEMSATSVAAASLGQVYKAKVRKTGQLVAVKVQRPFVRESISLDVYIMRYIAGKFGVLRKLNSDLPSLLDEWAGSLFRELDYRREAWNGKQFKELYKHLEGVYIPDMLHELTTARVLTMEWLEGVRLRSAGQDPSEGRALRPEDMKLVGYGVQCSLEQMLEEGFYHADPHPGNLLKTNDGKLGYLDFGMMASIGPQIRRALIQATLHMVNREFRSLANDFEVLGLLPPGSNKDQVVPALSRVFEKALAQGVSNMSFGSLSGDLGRTMYEFSFRIPPYYTLLVRSLSVLEGIALSSDPNYKVLGAAYPWVARRLLTNSNPELQDTLKILLYKDNKFQFSRLESLLRQALKSPARVDRGSGAVQKTGSENALGGKPLELLLGEKGSFVRNIVLDELAKGIDAALRLSTDGWLQDVRSQVSSLFMIDQRRRPSRQQAGLPGNLMATLNSLPTLADSSDTAQVEGIKSLVRVLQEVRDGNGAESAPAGKSRVSAALPAQVNEAIVMLQWFAREVNTLSPAARAEALRLPLSLGSRLSSRFAARAIKALVGSEQNGKDQGNGTLPSRARVSNAFASSKPQPAAASPAVQASPSGQSAAFPARNLQRTQIQVPQQSLVSSSGSNGLNGKQSFSSGNSNGKGSNGQFTRSAGKTGQAVMRS